MANDNQAEREKLTAWVRLHLIENVGSRTFTKLLEHFATAEKVLKASRADLAKVEGIGEKKADIIARGRDEVDAEEEIMLATELGIEILTLESAAYPLLLKKIYDPPPVLYVKGKLTPADNLAIAIVGSRQCSYYGRDQASRFAHLLANAGVTIVSGLARGIDTAAHEGALAGGGRTIAVQGRGLADVYPPENRALAQRIEKQGALVSEFPLRYEPLKNLFPQRNRIISGLSLATMVAEARDRSGALITAKLALEQSRDVLAIPGAIDLPGSKGPNQLIKEGAKLVDSLEDVMEALDYIGVTLKDHVQNKAKERRVQVEEPPLPPRELKLSADEKTVYGKLTKEARHVEEILQETDLPISGLNAALIQLQLKGLLKQLPGNFYLRR